MNLAQLKENSRAEHYAVQAFLSVLHGDPVELITTAMEFVASSKYFANTPPPGDADGIDDLADGYGESVTKAQELSDQIATIATQGLPDAIAGRAGTTIVEVVESFGLVLLSDIEGLTSARSALRKYASDLRASVRLHAIGAADIWSGRSLIKSLRPDAAALLIPWERGEEILRLLDQLRRGMQLINDGVAQCHTAYSQSWDDGLALIRRSTDSMGYARLAGVSVPEGMNAFDVMAARTVSPDGNPDLSILSATEWANYEKRWSSLSTAERDRVLAALREAEDSESRAIILSALATGAPISSVVSLAAELANMTADQRAEIANLNIWDYPSAGGSHFAQLNTVTCGSTTLIALAAQSDPFLAYWLATGLTLEGHIPPYLSGIDVEDASSMSAAERIIFLEEAVQARANVNPLFPGGSWFTDWGTDPVGAEVDASRTGTDYNIDWNKLALLDEDNQAALTAAAEAANSGTPVPLLVDPSDGLIPQHYVLIVGYHDGVYEIYDPGQGEVFEVAESTMINGSDSAVEGFGNWRQIYGVMNPVN